MDPDSGPRNTHIINFIPENINWDRVFFEEINGEKIFSFAYFNECTHSLVTCHAIFNGNYDLLSCNIDVNLLDKYYEEISEHDNELSLSDLFSISKRLSDNERLCLSYDDRKTSAYMIGDNYKTETNASWVIEYALKEDEPRYMDTIDRMVEFLGIRLDNSKRHRTVKPFKMVENISKMRQVKPVTLLKKVG